MFSPTANTAALAEDWLYDEITHTDNTHVLRNMRKRRRFLDRAIHTYEKPFGTPGNSSNVHGKGTSFSHCLPNHFHRAARMATL